VTPSSFVSVTETVLVTSIEGVDVIDTIVGSLACAVFGSSDVSLTVDPLGVFADADATFITSRINSLLVYNKEC